MKKNMRYSVLALATMFSFGCGGGSDSVVATIPTGTSPNVVTQPVVPGTPPALSPDGIVFFRAGAAGGGDGTANSPFNDLAAAIAATPAGKTLFLYAGAGPVPFSGTIPGNIRILGEGLGFSTSGFSVAGGAFPRLQGSITLADGAVVQGVQFENPTGDAVSAGSLTSLVLDFNRFNNIAGDAVHIERANGTISVTNNSLVDDSLDPGDGLDLSIEQTDSLTLTFSNNDVTTPSRSNSFDNGLKLVTGGSSHLTLVAEENSFDVQGRGIQVQVGGSSVFSGAITGNTFLQTPLEGISVTTGLALTDPAQSAVTVSSNTFTRPLGPALSLLAGGVSTNTWTVDNNNVDAAGNFGVLLVRGDSAFVRSSVTANRISNALQVGLQYTSGTASGGFTVPLAGEDRMTISQNQITGSGVSSIDLNLVSQTHAALLSQNTTDGPIVVLARAVNSCLGAGANVVGGNFTVNVESGFSLTYDDRGQTAPAVAFPGGGSVTPGVCNP